MYSSVQKVLREGHTISKRRGMRRASGLSPWYSSIWSDWFSPISTVVTRMGGAKPRSADNDRRVMFFGLNRLTGSHYRFRIMQSLQAVREDVSAAWRPAGSVIENTSASPRNCAKSCQTEATDLHRRRQHEARPRRPFSQTLTLQHVCKQRISTVGSLGIVPGRTILASSSTAD